MKKLNIHTGIKVLVRPMVLCCYVQSRGNVTCARWLQTLHFPPRYACLQVAPVAYIYGTSRKYNHLVGLGPGARSVPHEAQ